MSPVGESFSDWNQYEIRALSVCLTLSLAPFLPLLMIKTDVSPDCCACLMLSWRENISDVGNEYPRTEHSSQFDLCLQGPTALALMNWRGGFCYPTPTTTESPYRVRRTASSVTFTLWTQCFFSHLLRAVVGLPSCSLSDTTREKRRQEKEGVDYHFVSVPMFEEDILNHRCALVVSFPMVLKITHFSWGWSPPFLLQPDHHFIPSFLSVPAPPSRFIEYGRYNGHYYGTSLDSVNRVMAEGKVCLLDVHPGVSIRTSKKFIFG